MSQSNSRSSSEPADAPGADRFWGQFSRAGRDREERQGPRPQDGPHRGDSDRARPDRAGDGGEHGHGECLEWCPVCRSAELIRSAVTPELKEQAEHLQREALNVLQAFLSAYAERAGQDAAEPSRPGSAEPAAASGPGADDPGITEIPLD